MGPLPRELFWSRRDLAGCEHVLLDDRHGLLAHGTAQAVDPVPYTCRYQLVTDEQWATRLVEVEAEGAGWRRHLRLERAGGRWRVTATEQGRLDGAPPGTEDSAALAEALDVDLGGSPLTNTLPLRRLGLVRPGGGPATERSGNSPAEDRHGDSRTEHRIVAAWVLLPTLEVVASEQAYTMLGEGRVRYASGTFSADLELDTDGYVRRYPGLAERVG